MADHGRAHEEAIALNPWRPTQDLLQLAVLGKAIEESAELICALARCVIQGIDECEPVSRKPNRDWLREEMADTEACLQRLRERLDIYTYPERYMAKLKHLDRWDDLIRAMEA